MTQYFDQLQPKHNDASVIQRSDYNAIVQGIVRASKPAGASYSNEYFQFGQFDKAYPVPYWFSARSATKMRINSICVLDISAMSTNLKKRVRGGITICVKPYDEDKGRPFLFTNDISACRANGTCMVRVIDYMQPMLFWSEPGEVPEPGFPCGPINGQFSISRYGCGMTCLTSDSTRNKAITLLDQPGRRWLVKPNADINADDTGDVVVQVGPPGSEIPGPSPITLKDVYNRTSAICKADKFAEVVEIDGKRYIVPWECDASTTTPP